MGRPLAYIGITKLYIALIKSEDGRILPLCINGRGVVFTSPDAVRDAVLWVDRPVRVVPLEGITTPGTLVGAWNRAGEAS